MHSPLNVKVWTMSTGWDQKEKAHSVSKNGSSSTFRWITVQHCCNTLTEPSQFHQTFKLLSQFMALTAVLLLPQETNLFLSSFPTGPYRNRMWRHNLIHLGQDMVQQQHRNMFGWMKLWEQIITHFSIDKKPTRCHFCVILYFSLTSCSTCFGQPCAHL